MINLPYSKKLNLEGMLNYIGELNDSSMDVHGEIGTHCMDSHIEEHISKYGEFVLGIVPSEVLPYHPCKHREEKVSELFENDKFHMSTVYPIIIHNYDSSMPRDYQLSVFDGQTRSGVAHMMGIDILGYASESVVNDIPGFKRLDNPVNYAYYLLNK